jgi:ATP-dependent DNA helicase RecQ
MPLNPVSDQQIREGLSSTFGYSSFRPLQEEIVRSILDGRDVFVLMPTGGGKSLCYQLPALLQDGLTVVVSPLIALMKDQVDALHELGAPATFINSSLDSGEISRRQAKVARGEIKLLYVAPERLMLPAFLHLLANTKLRCIAIDEAHCISEWGHDFRPEYRELTRLRRLFPSVTFAAFTATATQRVQADIVQQLGLQGAAAFRRSFNRPNLFYEVRPKKDAPCRSSARPTTSNRSSRTRRRCSRTTRRGG